LPTAVFEGLPEESKIRVTEAIMRAIDIDKGIIKIATIAKAIGKENPWSKQGAVVQTPPLQREAVVKAPRPQPSLKQVWPEGHQAKMMLKEWCEEQGVPGPGEELSGHHV